MTMQKNSEATAPHQVIEITEESKKKAKKVQINCFVKAATMLGVVQIICGMVALAIWIIGNDNTFSFGKGIWTFTLFVVSGVLTIRVVESRNRWLITASIVMSINSADSAGFLLIKAGISHGFSNSFGYDYGFDSSIGSFIDENINYGGISDYSNQSYNYRYVEDVVKVMMAWMMLMACTASVILTAVTHCCPSKKSKLCESGILVHYNSSQLDLTNHQDLHISRIQLNSSVNLENLRDIPDTKPSLDEPPTYQEVTGVRGKC